MQRIAAALLFLFPVGALKAADADALVRGLRHPEFSSREAAAVQLQRLGLEAAPALERGLQDPDPEVRDRCAELLKRAGRPEAERRLLALLEDPELPEAKAVPGWERFRKRYGAEREARELFVSLAVEGLAVYHMLDEDPENLPGHVPDLFLKVWCLARAAAEEPSLRGLDAGVHVPGSVAAALFIAIEAPNLVSRQADEGLIDSILRLKERRPECLPRSPTFRRLATDFLRRRIALRELETTILAAQALDLTDLVEEELKPKVRRLAESLATKPPDPCNCIAVLDLAEQVGLDEIQAVVAREVPRFLEEWASPKLHRADVWNLLLRSELRGRPETAAFVLQVLRGGSAASEPEERARAIQLVYQLGRTDLVHELEPLLSDTAILTNDDWALRRPIPRGAIHLAKNLGEVRDVALGVLVLWNGQHPSAYKFPQFEFVPDTDPAAVTWNDLVFGNDAKGRTAALAKWRAYQGERKTRRAPQDDSPEAALVRRLGSDDWAEREDAADRLRRLGVRAEPLLKTGLDHADPEVASRCRRLLKTP